MYQAEIRKYLETNTCFTTNEIQKSLRVSDETKKIFNTELARMEKTGCVKRVYRGFYIVPQKSCFGIDMPSESEIVKRLYMANSSGYVSGPTFLNRIGLSSWIPNKAYIKSNYYKCNMQLSTFVINKPKTMITNDNKRYLQLLDGIEDLNKFAVDYENPPALIYGYLVSNDIDPTKLLLMAHRYYPARVLETLYPVLEAHYGIA